MNKKKVVISVTNDLVTDQRVRRTIGVLLKLKYEVTFVGRKLPNSLPIERPYAIRRFKLWFNKGFLFYANYNIRLFFFLLFRKYDVYFSNDLDTLLPNYILSKIRGKKLIYDSHEYFTGVPEIQNRPFVKKVWTIIERLTMPKVDAFITVNDSIAQLYQDDYGMKATVIRNISDADLPETKKSRKDLDLPENKFICINQGAGINVDRGMEEFLEALEQINNVVLVLVGKGDVYPILQQIVQEKNIQDKVIFISPKPYMEMLQYTINADCGLSLDKPTNMNYKYSLPNKLFDYVQCRIPVITSDVVEVSKLVKSYKIGEVIEDHTVNSMMVAVEKLQSKSKIFYSEGLEKIANENNWKLESEKLEDLLVSAIS